MDTHGNHFAFVGITSRIFADVAPQVEVSKTPANVIIRAI
jgi:hypothetical protein